MSQARAFLEKLEIPAHARVEEFRTGTKDRLGRPYTKWRARWGSNVKSLPREDVADVQQALDVLAEERVRILEGLTPEQREALGVKKTEAVPIKVYAGGRVPK